MNENEWIALLGYLQAYPNPDAAPELEVAWASSMIQVALHGANPQTAYSDYWASLEASREWPARAVSNIDAAREAIAPYLDFIEPQVLASRLPLLLDQLGFDGSDQKLIAALSEAIV